MIAGVPAKVIGLGSAKVIADHWTDERRPVDAGPMTARATDMHRLTELVRLHRQGMGARAVARLLGMSPNTERKYREALESAGLFQGSPEALPDLEELKRLVGVKLPPLLSVQQRSTVEGWREKVKTMRSAGLGPRAIYDRLRVEDPSFGGSLSAIKRMSVRLSAEQGPKPKDVAIPVDTAAGDVAQVDFGYAGKLWDEATGRLRKAWVFVMVLGYSRHRFDKVVLDQKQETWCELHEEAFRAFEGVTRRSSRTIDLATCNFVNRKENVLLLGGTGVGKSHIAQALGHRASSRASRMQTRSSRALHLSSGNDEATARRAR